VLGLGTVGDRPRRRDRHDAPGPERLLTVVAGLGLDAVDLAAGGQLGRGQRAARQQAGIEPEPSVSPPARRSLTRMVEWRTATQFSDADGVQDWRPLGRGACAWFRTGSFTTGVTLVGAIGELAEAADHHPDVDLRSSGVLVRLFTQDALGLTQRDVDLAQQISTVARELDIPADPAGIQDVEVTIDALVPADVLPFWRAVLGYEQVGDTDLLDPAWRGPSIWFQQMDARRPDRNRVHVDVWVPHDQAEARIAAAIAAGGHLVSDARAPAWWTLADAEGNEVDVATWQGRD